MVAGPEQIAEQFAAARNERNAAGVHGAALTASTLAFGWSLPAIPSVATAVGVALSVSTSLDIVHARHLCPRCT